ncbi:hypothetical protein GGI35DRAFT_213051 [Trichoderma velutinum]
MGAPGQDRDKTERLVIDQTKVPRFRLPARRAPHPRRAILCPIHPCLLFFFASCAAMAEMKMTCTSFASNKLLPLSKSASRPSAVAWHCAAARHSGQLNQPWDETGFVRDAVPAAPHSELDDWVVLDPWNPTVLPSECCSISTDLGYVEVLVLVALPRSAQRTRYSVLVQAYLCL